MYPRPRARGKAIDYVAAADLAEEVRAMRLERDPVAIVTGAREWRYVRSQRDWLKHGAHWPGGEETFAGVPVVIHRFATTPRVIGTLAELEEALLGEP